MSHKKVLLIILDGWGITQDPAVSAIAQAHTPCMDALFQQYPHAHLLTDGLHVGLPEGQMGNSEVGHINLGAGRIIYQELARINLAIKNNTLANESVLINAFAYAKRNRVNTHLIGLVSDGGVHSHVDHLKGLVEAAEQAGLDQVFIHAFTDGRDVDPHSGKKFIADLQQFLKGKKTQLASVVGRYFAMDRDKRWERVQKAYNLLVHGQGMASTDAVASIQESYDVGITDEFIEPIVITKQGNPLATVAENDVVIFFNFRTDRGRQLTQSLTQTDFPAWEMKKMPLHMVTMTNYDDTFEGIQVIYNKQNVTQTLGEVLEKNRKKQIRIAETEKYPHVTFFFSGGREEPFVGEKRILCPSPQVPTYDLQPEMSAYDIRDKILPEIKNQSADFICLNFANPDMVGHTGVFKAAVKACETVDQCVGDLVPVALENNYTTLIIADHGNSEMMINADGSPNTAHTTNPVPIIVVDPDIKSVKNGILANIAPTVLKILDIEKPFIMTEESLI